MSTIQRVDVVGDQILRDGEGDAADENGGPDLLHAAPAGEGPDQPERHDDREERKLPADHGAEQVGIEPVAAARPAMGVPSAPKATGAVLAMSERPAAASGEKPSPIRIAPVTATGVPKPAAPSKNAPKAERDQEQLQPAVGRCRRSEAAGSRTSPSPP